MSGKSVSDWLRGTASFDQALADVDRWLRKRSDWSLLTNNDVNVHLFVRSNINWRYVTLEQLAAKERFGKFPSNTFAAIKQWNKSFITTYQEYRAFLQRLSERTWTTIHHIDTILKDNFDFVEVLLNEDCNHRCVVLPTDDDDWFAPNLSDAVIELYRDNPEADAICWSTGSLHHSKGIAFHRNDEQMFHTNSYALTDRGIRKLLSIDRRAAILALKRHAAAQKIFHDTDLDFSIISAEADSCYGIKNSSPASLTELTKIWTGEEATEMVAVSVHHEPDAIPPSMIWALQSIRQMNDFSLERRDD